MSAAKWRRAMASAQPRQPSHYRRICNSSRPRRTKRVSVLTGRSSCSSGFATCRRGNGRRRCVDRFSVRGIAVHYVPDRRTKLALGLIALSLTFLGGYGGMVSLAQMTVAGIAGYSVAILGASSAAEISLNWPWWLVVPCAVLIATVCAAGIAWLSVRTEGIYTIMITLAIGVAFSTSRCRTTVCSMAGKACTKCIRRSCSASTGAIRCRSTS